jgi:hypothetical protein
VSFEGPSLDDILLMVVKNVSIQTLRHLELEGMLDPKSIAYFSHFSRLQSLSLQLSRLASLHQIGEINSSLIENLSRLPLMQLCLDLQLFITRDLVLEQHLPYRAFPNLTTLSFKGTTPIILYILDALAGNRLQSIHIWEYSTSTSITEAAEDHAWIYQKLARFTSLRQISYNFLELENYEIGLISEPVNAISIVQPFLGLMDLEVLDLEFLQPWFRISDDDISTLAFGCPSLKALHLYPERALGEVDNLLPTFASLRCLAMTLPNLVSLAVALDVQELPLNLPPTGSPHGLRKFFLHDTFTDRPPQFAQLLHQIFPLLQRVEGEGIDDLHLINVFLAAERIRTSQKMLCSGLEVSSYRG